MIARKHGNEIKILSISCLLGLGFLMGCGSRSTQNHPNLETPVNSGVTDKESNAKADANLPPIFSTFVFDLIAYIVMPQKGCFKAERAQNSVSITTASCTVKDTLVKVPLEKDQNKDSIVFKNPIEKSVPSDDSICTNELLMLGVIGKFNEEAFNFSRSQNVVPYYVDEKNRNGNVHFYPCGDPVAMKRLRENFYR